MHEQDFVFENGRRTNVISDYNIVSCNFYLSFIYSLAGAKTLRAGQICTKTIDNTNLALLKRRIVARAPNNPHFLYPST